jgi:hypothetical protein
MMKSREDVTQGWAQAIKANVRPPEGGVLTDAAASDYADQFWRSLEQRHVPIKEIMAVPGRDAVAWVLLAAAPATTIEIDAMAIDEPPEFEEDHVKTAQGKPIDLGTRDVTVSVYALLNATIRVKGDDGEYHPVPVQAELEIHHGSLRQLVQKANTNMSKKSSDGAVTVRIRG